MSIRLGPSFFERDVLDVAPALLGKTLVRRYENGRIERFTVTETEAYRGEEDLACHARKGKTPRTEVMYASGGHIYIYLIYGMYWMLNFVTGNAGQPQAVLIRGIEGCNGPGKLTRLLQLDKTFNKEALHHSERLWVEDGLEVSGFKTGPRIGIDYAGEHWKTKPWRYIL
jgi:DNA-3-methyladenine glycosylase